MKNSTTLLTSEEVERWTLLIHSCIHKMQIKPMAVWDYDDMVQDCLHAVLRCKLRYDESSKASFTTYAMNRVKGTLLDELRSWTWQPKSALKSKDVYVVVPIDDFLSDDENNKQIGYSQDFDSSLELDLMESKLKGDELTVFKMFRADKGTMEIARELKRSNTFVLDYKHSAIEKLKAA